MFLLLLLLMLCPCPTLVRLLLFLFLPSTLSLSRYTSLVTRPKYPPPYRETGVAIPLSHCVFCGIADYRCYTTTSFRENGLSQSKTGLGGGGGIAEKACP